VRWTSADGDVVRIRGKDDITRTSTRLRRNGQRISDDATIEELAEHAHLATLTEDTQ
jgi:hypothetical protein